MLNFAVTEFSEVREFRPSPYDQPDAACSVATDGRATFPAKVTPNAQEVSKSKSREKSRLHP
jgi:hypothetical protein